MLEPENCPAQDPARTARRMRPGEVTNPKREEEEKPPVSRTPASAVTFRVSTSRMPVNPAGPAKGIPPPRICSPWCADNAMHSHSTQRNGTKGSAKGACPQRISADLGIQSRPLPQLPGGAAASLCPYARRRRESAGCIRRIHCVADDEHLAPLAGHRRGGCIDLRPVR